MRFSLNWLRELAALPDDAGEVARALTARGLTVDAVEDLGEDCVLEIDVPANRPDCLGHRGVAREAAAACGTELAAAPHLGAELRGSGDVSVTIDEPRLCRRYTAGVVRDVRVAPSPAWVVRRLEACGLRSIDNVVDISNLVLLELGNPIHFFDLDRLSTGRVGVRRARSGERLTTLDDVERRLQDDILVITDGEHPVALAGIMGGAETEIGPDTRNVLIEAAHFDPGTVRAGARRLALLTDASHRFERGVDAEAVVTAQSLAAHWLTELGGGRPASAVADVYPAPPERRRLSLRRNQLPRLLGYTPTAEETDGALRALGLAPQPAGEHAVETSIPSHRPDLLREADLVEEVARHLGYDRIPAERAETAAAPRHDPQAELEERARERLAQLGFHEAYGYSMIGQGDDAPFVPGETPQALELANPLSESMQFLRRSLLPGLLRAASLNLRRGVEDVRLFEIEHVFVGDRRDRSFPAEPLALGFVWVGAPEPEHWSRPRRELDLFDAAGIVDSVIRHLRPELATQRVGGTLDGLHPGQTATWQTTDTGAGIAFCGRLHPAEERRLELAQATFVGSVNLEALAAVPGQAATFRPLARVGAVSRDLAVVLPSAVSWLDVRNTLLEVQPPAAAHIRAVDRYAGPPLGPGESSLTVRVTLRPMEHSLTEEQIEGYRSALVRALEQRGLRLRG